MDLGLLSLFHELDLLDELPDAEPEARQVLSRRCCPLHDGADNPNAFLLYGDGFACTTRQCHKDRRFGCNLFGLVRHLVYRVTGEDKPFRDAVRYVRQHKDKLRRLVPAGVRYRGRTTSARPTVAYDAADLADCLRVPDDYCLGRGYAADTLSEFGVGTCVRRLPDGGNHLGWSVIPVFDGRPSRTRDLVGYTARNPAWSEGDHDPRWVTRFEKSHVLFNYANASRYRREPLFVCEGPGDVMRLWEAGFRAAVATFGAAISDEQVGLVWSLLRYLQPLYVAADADKAGRKFASDVWRRVGNDAEVVYPIGEAKDFGEMTVEQIRSMGL